MPPRHIYRLHRPDQHAFDTTGCRFAEGRWHSRFTLVVYAAEHISLATLETLVHAGGRKLPARALSQITIPTDDLIEHAPWLDFPQSQAFGNTWVTEQRSPVLAVPSAVIRQETNYILNPAHPAFSKITTAEPEPFTFDPRLFNTGR